MTPPHTQGSLGFRVRFDLPASFATTDGLRRSHRYVQISIHGRPVAGSDPCELSKNKGFMEIS